MNILGLISSTVLLILLGCCAYLDLKSKTLPVFIIAGGFVSGIVLQIFLKQITLWEIVTGCGIGLIITIIAFLSRQSIGYGDGLLFVATGAFLGFMDNLWLLIFSLGISMVIGIGLLIFGRLSRKTAIPFAPCILCGYLGLLALG